MARQALAETRCITAWHLVVISDYTGRKAVTSHFYNTTLTICVEAPFLFQAAPVYINNGMYRIMK